MKNYIEEYQKLLNFIKNKLNGNYLEELYVQIYLIYIDGIEEKIKNDPSEINYEAAIKDLKIIIDEIKSLDHSVSDNYHLVNTKNIEENDDKELDNFIDNVSKNVNKAYEKNSDSKQLSKEHIINRLKWYKYNIKKNKKSSSNARAAIFAYLLVISILLSVPISTLIDIRKKREYKIVYPTKEIMYSSILHQEYDDGYYGSLPIMGDVLTHKVSYQEFEDVGENGYVTDNEGRHNCYYIIKEKTPWNIIDNEATRTVKTYVVAVNEIGNVVNFNDISTFLSSNNIDSKKEIIYVRDIPRSEHVFYSEEENKDKSIYEVTRCTQDLDHPVAKYLATDYTDLFIVLASELLIWLCLVQTTNNTIIEGIIKSINKLKANKRLTKIQEKKLTELYNSYVSIYNPQNINIKKRRKK